MPRTVKRPANPELPWKVTTLSRNVFEIRAPVERRTGWEFWVLLTSDRHWDNPASDWGLQREHLEEAKARRAPVIDCGDFFCAMQGRWDKRSDRHDLRPEHAHGDYLDSLVTTAADFFEPYATNFAVIASGNHEESIRLRHETSLIERLCAALNDRTSSKIHHGGYSGFVRFSFRVGAGRSFGFFSHTLNYSHGYGGGGPVTKDVIQHQRRAVYTDADIVVSGHTHDEGIQMFEKLRLTRDGKIVRATQTHVKIPSYKNDFGDGFEGWAARRGAPPKPIGAAWLRFYWHNRPHEVRYEITPAK